MESVPIQFKEEKTDEESGSEVHLQVAEDIKFLPFFNLKKGKKYGKDAAGLPRT